jgi:hypothetical protein
VGRPCRLDTADHYRRDAIDCGEMAKYVRPPLLGDLYRRVAVRYVFMAEEILNEARARGEIANEDDRSALLGVGAHNGRWWQFQHDKSSELAPLARMLPNLIGFDRLRRERTMAGPTGCGFEMM